jgi:hypothetical protein
MHNRHNPNFVIVSTTSIFFFLKSPEGGKFSLFWNFVYFKKFQTLEALLEMFNKDNRDGSTYDAYMVMQAMR